MSETLRSEVSGKHTVPHRASGYRLVSSLGQFALINLAPPMMGTVNYISYSVYS